LLAFLCAPGAHAEVRDRSPQGFTVENARVVTVDAAAAWKARAEDVDRWWPKDHTWWGEASTLSIDSRADGCFCERGDGREASHMRVALVDPGELLRMVGGLGPLQGMGLHGAMEWRLEPVDEGTRIILRYRAGGYTPDDLSGFAAVVDKVQALQLDGLADFLKAQRASGNTARRETMP
jgi:uncharacterized protein YndB with AHSA1/START domain